MKFKRFGALLLSAVLCIGMAAPAFAYEGDTTPVEQPVLPEVVEEDTVTITDEESGALTPEGNLTLVDDYHTNYSDGSGQQFITLVSKSGATFYLVIDRNAKGQQTVHFMNLVDEADLLALMEEEDVSDFDSFWNRYVSYLQSYSFPLLVKSPIEVYPYPDAAARVASTILSRDDYDFPVYFVAFKIPR